MILIFEERVMGVWVRVCAPEFSCVCMCVYVCVSKHVNVNMITVSVRVYLLGMFVLSTDVNCLLPLIKFSDI